MKYRNRRWKHQLPANGLGLRHRGRDLSFCPAAYGENCDFDFCCDPSFEPGFPVVASSEAAGGMEYPCGGGGGCRVFGPLSQLRGFGSADKPVRPGDYGTGPYAVGAHGQCRCGSAGFVPGEPEPEGELDGGGAFTSVRYPTGKRFRPAFRRNFVRL